jgi:hypothetical protein
LENEAAPFAQRDNPFHEIIRFGFHHRSHSFKQRAADVKASGADPNPRLTLATLHEDREKYGSSKTVPI